ncbi:MAG TPA: PfkB family carbohydrate kinase [Gaiellaceae bacterium]|nr:PfkB family carbohydrate kinase [Gaiellaceae bacterium]
MHVAVVGHVEWVDFLHVERVPREGEIVQADDAWQLAAGGGADAAVQLLKLAGGATLFTALGDDPLGRRAHDELRARALRLEVAWRDDPQRRAVCFLDADGERTIALLGPKLVPHGSDPLPWHELDGADGVYFSGGDLGALRAARRAKVLVASARELHVLREAGVELDVLVASAADPGERYEGGLDPRPRYVVRTEGARGGVVEPGGRFPPGEPAGPLVDTYGAGDAFAAGLTYGLAAGMAIDEALALGARCGATVLTGRGPYEAQLTAQERLAKQ